jgi:WD40 repeat protein
MAEATDSRQAMNQQLREWLEFMRAESHILRERPQLLFQQAANRPDQTTPARMAQIHFQARLQTLFWLRWADKVMTGGCRVATLTAHASSINACAFSPDGARFVSASADNTLKLWDVADWQERATLAGHASAVKDCAFSPDSALIASVSSDRTLRLWDAVNGREAATFRAHKHGVNACAFSADGKQIATGSDDWTLKLWDRVSGRLIESFYNSEYEVTACAFSPNGAYLISGSGDGSVILWNARARKFMGRLRGPVSFFDYPLTYHAEITACRLSPDGSRIAFSSMDGALRFLLGRDRSSTSRDYAGGVMGFAFSPDGSAVVAAGGDGAVRILEAGSAREHAEFHLRAKPRSVAWSPDGRLIAVGTAEGTLVVLRVESSRRGARRAEVDKP